MAHGPIEIDGPLLLARCGAWAHLSRLPPPSSSFPEKTKLCILGPFVSSCSLPPLAVPPLNPSSCLHSRILFSPKVPTFSLSSRRHGPGPRGHLPGRQRRGRWQRSGSPPQFFFSPFFFLNLWLNTPAVTPLHLWIIGCLLGGKAGEGGKQGDGCLPRRRVAQNVHPRDYPGEALVAFHLIWQAGFIVFLFYAAISKIKACISVWQAIRAQFGVCLFWYSVCYSQSKTKVGSRYLMSVSFLEFFSCISLL